MEEVKKQEMESLFCPYEQALELKDLGFDKRCFTTYTPKHLGNELSNPFNIDLDEFNELKSSFTLINLPNKAFVKNSECVNCVSAPLWQQAFDWFRQEHGLYSHVRESYAFDNTLEFVTQINGSYVNHGIEDKPINRFETYEEAELECLKKLIEIVKEQNVK